MAKTVISVEDLSKIYRLGEIGTGTLSHDLNRWWKMSILGQEDPFAKIGQVNDRAKKAEKGEFIAALQDINFKVNEGDILGIIGKNGAGKSTLLKILSRVTSPTSGVVKIKGRIASLLEVGTGFHPEMTGRENIYMNGTIMGMRKWEIDKKLDEIVDFAGVEKFIDTPTKRYSSGMTVRLGFSIAAHLEPEILVVDEVLAVGDAEFQRKAIGKMQDVSQGEGRTVLFVSHNMGSIRSLCTKCLVLNNGIVKFQGETLEAIDYYLNQNSILACKGILNFENKNIGDNSLKLLEISVSDNKNRIRTSYLQSEEINVRITFNVLNKIKDARFNLKVKSIHHVDVFMTSSHELTKSGLDVGIKTLELKLPSFLFNKTRYILAINAGIPKRKVIFKFFDALYIDIEGSNNNGKWSGLVAPKIQWHILN